MTGSFWGRKAVWVALDKLDGVNWRILGAKRVRRDGQEKKDLGKRRNKIIYFYLRLGYVSSLVPLVTDRYACV